MTQDTDAHELQVSLNERTYERDQVWRRVKLAHGAVLVLQRTLDHLAILIGNGETADRLLGKLNVAQLEAQDLAKLLTPSTKLPQDRPSIGADVPGGGAV